MRVEFRDLRRGVIRLRVESLDDLWYLNQILVPGDRVRAKTHRRVKDRDDSRSKGGERVTVSLALDLESTQLNLEDHVLRVLGKISEGVEEIAAIGSHHTLNIEADSTLTIEKSWSKTDLENIDYAVKGTLRPKVVVVSIDVGEAAVALIRNTIIEYLDLERNIGGKYDLKDREKRKNDYYKELAEVLSSIDSKNDISSFVLSGPGFEKNNFHNHLRQANPAIASKSVIEDTGSSGRAGVREVLSRKTIQRALEDMNSVRDMRLMEDILVEISRDKGLAAYGMEDVELAVESKSAEFLLATDILFERQRPELEAMFNSMRFSGGRPHIIDGAGEAGQKLSSLGGIAAKLRFKVS